MTFCIDDFKEEAFLQSPTYAANRYIDDERYRFLEKAFGGGPTHEEALDRVEERTSEAYSRRIRIAQTAAVAYAKYVFPAYKFLLPDIVMDDWLSVIDPHKPGKRDHSLHQPLTAYIVAKMLGYGDAEEGLVINGKPLLTHCAETFLNSPKMAYLKDYLCSLANKEIPVKGPLRKIWAETVFYETAVMSALFHDIGYPWQYLRTISNSLTAVGTDLKDEYFAKRVFEKIKGKPMIFPFYAYLQTALSHPEMSYQSKVYEMIDEAYQQTHGFPGALAFSYLSDYVRRFPVDMDFAEATCRFMQDWAALGIMMHDMSRLYRGKCSTPLHPQYHLSMYVDPLSCLIALADILEEFGRPAASFKASSDNTSIFYDYPCLLTEISVKGNQFHINYVYGTKGDRMEYESKRKSEVDSYFNDKYSFIDMTSIGIEGAECTTSTITDSKQKTDLFRHHLLRALISILPQRGEGLKVSVGRKHLSRFSDLDLKAQMNKELQKEVQRYPYLFRYVDGESSKDELVFVDIVPQN